MLGRYFFPCSISLTLLVHFDEEEFKVHGHFLALPLEVRILYFLGLYLTAY